MSTPAATIPPTPENVALYRAAAIAYPHQLGIAWGVNAADGRNILRGVRRPDGQDVAVG